MSEGIGELQSADLKVGTRLRHRDGSVSTLVRRKVKGEGGRGRFYPGWWIEEGGGLADFVIDAENSDWEVLP